VDDYLPILILLILAFLFAALSFVASSLLGPRKRPTAAKVAPYECGIVPGIDPPTRFPVRFYLIAMIFIIFDIEIVFLYPWAVIFRQLRSFGLVEVVVFAAVVFISFLFLISNGALNWGPAKRLASAMPPRTSQSTIARITAGPVHARSPQPGGSPADPRAPAITDPDAPTTGDPAPVPTGPGRAA
jgi:NADH-quinone oxidoreductase subunit A